MQHFFQHTTTPTIVHWLRKSVVLFSLSYSNWVHLALLLKVRGTLPAYARFAKRCFPTEMSSITTWNMCTRSRAPTSCCPKWRRRGSKAPRRIQTLLDGGRPLTAPRLFLSNQSNQFWFLNWKVRADFASAWYEFLVSHFSAALITTFFDTIFLHKITIMPLFPMFTNCSNSLCFPCFRHNLIFVLF